MPIIILPVGLLLEINSNNVEYCKGRTKADLMTSSVIVDSNVIIYLKLHVTMAITSFKK